MMDQLSLLQILVRLVLRMASSTLAHRFYRLVILEASLFRCFRCLESIDSKHAECHGPPTCNTCLNRGVRCTWALLADRGPVTKEHLEWVTLIGTSMLESRCAWHSIYLTRCGSDSPMSKESTRRSTSCRKKEQVKEAYYLQPYHVRSKIRELREATIRLTKSSVRNSSKLVISDQSLLLCCYPCSIYTIRVSFSATRSSSLLNPSTPVDAASKAISPRSWADSIHCVEVGSPANAAPQGLVGGLQLWITRRSVAVFRRIRALTDLREMPRSSETPARISRLWSLLSPCLSVVAP